MQLQILKLEDGEYAKANGGFSLVRAGVKKVAPAISTATATDSVGAGRSEYFARLHARIASRDANTSAAMPRRNYLRWRSAVRCGSRRQVDPADDSPGQGQTRDSVLATQFQQDVDQDRCCQRRVRLLDRSLHRSCLWVLTRRLTLADSSEPRHRSRRRERVDSLPSGASHGPSTAASTTASASAVSVLGSWLSLLLHVDSWHVHRLAPGLAWVRRFAVCAGTGRCNNKNDCGFIHDSRRIAMCRKFLRNECADPNCLLSHQNDEVLCSSSGCFPLAESNPCALPPCDQNKVPVCSLFLRGACTREGCKYRHIKVSATAAVCADFVKGYCSKGAACPLRHELPSKNRAFSGVPKLPPVCSAYAQPQSEPNPTGKSVTPRVADAGAASSTTSAGPTGATPSTARAVASPASASEELSIRPNIRFAPRHGAAFSGLLDGL